MYPNMLRSHPEFLIIATLIMFRTFDNFTGTMSTRNPIRRDKIIHPPTEFCTWSSRTRFFFFLREGKKRLQKIPITNSKDRNR